MKLHNPIIRQGNLMDTADFKEARATRGCNDDMILSGVHRLSDSTGNVSVLEPLPHICVLIM